jgi:hypothetical protein
MVGGISFHRRIYKASLGRNAERVPSSEDKSEPFTARTLYVSLDNADTVIEGAPGSAFWYLGLVVACGFLAYISNVQRLTSLRLPFRRKIVPVLHNTIA